MYTLRGRWTRRALAATLPALVLVLSLGPAGPARAAAGTATCLGSAPVTDSPGVTDTPQAITFTETDDYGTCTSTDTTLTSGISATITETITGSCTATSGLLTASYTINWNNGQSSTADLTYTDTIVLGEEQLAGTGTITSGEFAGGNATIAWVFPALDPLQCLGPPGITSQDGTIVLQITAL
jgi:hypothetical protein